MKNHTPPGMPELRCITYVSSATTRLSDEALERLVLDARAFNQDVDVTGVLLYHDGTFFQYFEGPAGGVEQVYERIKNSRTHHSIYPLLDAAQPRRLFPNWLMGLSHVPASRLLALQNAEWQGVASGLDATAPPHHAGLVLLRTHWQDISTPG